MNKAVLNAALDIVAKVLPDQADLIASARKTRLVQERAKRTAALIREAYKRGIQLDSTTAGVLVGALLFAEEQEETERYSVPVHFRIKPSTHADIARAAAEKGTDFTKEARRRLESG